MGGHASCSALSLPANGFRAALPPSPCSAYTARQRYCRHVEAKLQQRAALRLQGRALAGWLEWQEAQQARQAQLRAAVRRMAFVRLYHSFSGGFYVGKGRIEGYWL